MAKIIKGKILSDSMTPIIKIGDEIIIDRSIQDYRTFDIIVFHNEVDKYICHIFIKYSQNKEKIITASYSNFNFDPIIDIKSVTGVVVNYKLNTLNKLLVILKYLFRKI